MSRAKRRRVVSVASAVLISISSIGAVALAATDGGLSSPGGMTLHQTIAFALLLTALAVGQIRVLFRFAAVHPLGTVLKRRRVLFVGVNPKTLEMQGSFQRDDEVEVVGFIDDPSRMRADVSLLGSFDQFEGVLRSSVVDAVMVGLPLRSHYDVISRILQTCETHGITAHYVLDPFPTQSDAKICVGEGATTLALHSAPIGGLQLWLKHGFDRVGAFVLLVLTSPILLLAMLAVKLADGGPIFFVQRRVGYNKRPFGMLKLRTMVPNADAMLASLEHLNECEGAGFKMKKDPRISRVGSFLRRYSIDELPQLINVLVGEMSLVGPRPISMRDYGLMPMDWQRRRFSMRPGLTCYWQVSGRHNTTFTDWMKLDLKYIDDFTLLLDLKILLKTIPAVLGGHGV